MIIKLLNDILTVEPRTANREPRTANRETSSLNFFISQKADIKICLTLLLQKLFSNLIKRLLFELPIFNQNFNFARNIYLNVFNKNLFSRRIFL